MFCPKCRSEYRKGLTTCSGCEIPLVGKLPPETSPGSELKPENINYVHLLSTSNLVDIALIKPVLDGRDIVHYFQGASFTYLMAQLTKLMVSEDDIGRAKELINELSLHYRSF